MDRISLDVEDGSQGGSHKNKDTSVLGRVLHLVVYVQCSVLLGLASWAGRQPGIVCSKFTLNFEQILFTNSARF